MIRQRIPLLYTIYTNDFYGTERMSLATAWGLRDEFDPIIITPAGPAATKAREMGLNVVETPSALIRKGVRSFDVWRFCSVLAPYVRHHSDLAFIGTHIGHCLSFAALSFIYGRRPAQFYVVHGPPDVSSVTRRALNSLPITGVAISSFSKERLIASGVREGKICIIENFLTSDQLACTVRRHAFDGRGITRAAVICRLVPVKRVDLLLTCLENASELNSITFHVYGYGSEHDVLQRRAKASGLNVIFEGFRTDVPEQLAQSDILVHLCADEPFGLVILEAMAAGVPVIVPDRGGAASLIRNGIDGLYFAADDAVSLASALKAMLGASPAQLNSFVDAGYEVLQKRFSDLTGVAGYRVAIRSALSDSRRKKV